MIIAGKVSCKKMILALMFRKSRRRFCPQQFAFNETAKIVTVKAEDLNGDKFPDIVLADATGDIKFYIITKVSLMNSRSSSAISVCK